MLKIKPLGASAILVILGLPIVFASEFASKHLSIHPALIALPAFCGYNFILASKLRLRIELKSYWFSPSIRAIVTASIIALTLVYAPRLLARILGVTIGNLQTPTISLKALATTFCIAGWEELWFRGMPLNYLAEQTSRITAAVFFSLLFVGMHALNPNMDLRAAAPNLFLASLMLSVGYFYFRSIWFSWITHWIWNSMNTSEPITQPSLSRFFWGKWIGARAFADRCRKSLYLPSPAETG